uniref:Uncharacterized protein n=1 Tax=Arundo donax TaxID=35708 RepID=A0A0A9D868_ARUDO
MLEQEQKQRQLYGSAHGAPGPLVKIAQTVYLAELTYSRKRCGVVQQYLDEACWHTDHRIPTGTCRKQLELSPQSL